MSLDQSFNNSLKAKNMIHPIRIRKRLKIFSINMKNNKKLNINSLKNSQNNKSKIRKKLQKRVFNN